jgi:hypothetical protein
MKLLRRAVSMIVLSSAIAMPLLPIIGDAPAVATCGPLFATGGISLPTPSISRSARRSASKRPCRRATAEVGRRRASRVRRGPPTHIPGAAAFRTRRRSEARRRRAGRMTVPEPKINGCICDICADRGRECQRTAADDVDRPVLAVPRRALLSSHPSSAAAGTGKRRTDGLSDNPSVRPAAADDESLETVTPSHCDR